MPIDPQIARGYQGGVVNAFHDARSQRQRMDSLANMDARRNALYQREDAQFQQQQVTDAQKAEIQQKWAELQSVKKGPPQVQAQWYAQQASTPDFAQTPYAGLPPEQALPMMEQHLAAMLGIDLKEQEAPGPIELQRLGGYQLLQQGGKVIPGSVQAPQRAPIQGATEAPADQRLYAWYASLPKDQQDAFLNMKRASATPEAAAGIASAKATATEQAKADVAAQSDLPRVEANADDMLRTLTSLEQSPGFDYLWGAYALTPGGAVPGTPQADAFAIWEQVQGKAFLEAFGTLKGGGQITEKEGEKATAAITRLSQRKQSPASARAAINDLRSVVTAGVSRAQKKARAQPGAVQRTEAPPAAVDHLRKNPQLKAAFFKKYGYLPDGI